MRVAKPHSRDSNNNNDIKEYIGGALYLATAGAAANLSELSVRRVLFDEIDRAKENVGGEGDPSELAEARQTTFERNRKTYYPSSPTIEGESVIEALFSAAPSARPWPSASTAAMRRRWTSLTPMAHRA